MDGIETLRSEGYRVTPQRQLVWQVLSRAHRHLSADQIHAEVSRTVPGFNVTSVYRTLTVLAHLGLVREVQLGDGPGQWEVSHADDEFHLVCGSCGAVSHHAGDLVARVRDHLTGGHGFVSEHIDLVVHGRCQECADHPEPGAGHHDVGATEDAGRRPR